MSAIRERDMILTWLERNHPHALTELIADCQGVLDRRVEPLAPGLIRRRTRDGNHVVTLRRLEPGEELTRHHPNHYFVAVRVVPPNKYIPVESVNGRYTAEYGYYADGSFSELDLTEPA